MERELIEGIDYSVENGLLVFPEYYLRERGYCCTNGCRHCPYGFERFDPSKVSDVEHSKGTG